MTMETERIKKALEITRYKYFGDYEFTERQREAANTLIELAEAVLKEREATEAEPWEGWAIVEGSDQHHYFTSGDNGGSSLCGKVKTNGKPKGLMKGGNAPPGNCYHCRKKIKFYRLVG